jgi:CMP/dCMP kinase
MIITIDGPAGTGKTTVAKRVAECLHIPYFDTGAIYRAVTWGILNDKIDASKPEGVAEFLQGFSFQIKGEGGGKRYFVGTIDVTEEIRSPEVTRAVSEISAMKEVRDFVYAIQRQSAAKDAVFEGRDMGTVVFPEAEIKIFLTARPEIRARRRLDEMLEKNTKQTEIIDYDLVLEDMIRRDQLDSTRVLAPLRRADDAYEIDTSELTIDEVVSKILEYKMSKNGKS